MYLVFPHVPILYCGCALCNLIMAPPFACGAL